MYCSKCGAKAIGGAAFCQKCGEKLIQDNRENQEPIPAPRQESEKRPIPSAKPTFESEQKSVKEEKSVLKGEPILVSAPEPVETPVYQARSTMETTQEVEALEESPSVSESDEDIYALLKENINMCPAIKSAKQGKKSVRLRGRIYNHSVKLVTVHTVQVRIRSVLTFPFSILYGVLAGLLCSTTWIIFHEFMKYGSICIEYYHGLLSALCCLVTGGVVLIHSCVGHKEKEAVEKYIREFLDSKQIYLSERKRVGAPKIKIVVAVVLVAAGIIILPLSLPEPVEYPDELLFDGLPADRFLEMTQKDVELEFGEKEPTNKNAITADDYYNYTYDGFEHVIYSKETGKVIYIEFLGSYCSYNRKNLDRSMERVLDILTEGDWYCVDPRRCAYEVYGSIHSGFYYYDGEYISEYVSADYRWQHGLEDSHHYQVFPLHTYGEKDYKIALTTVRWENDNRPLMLYNVCLYTDEWVETVEAADTSLEQTIMDNNTSTSGETSYDSIFGEALMQLIMYNTLPDGSVANDLDGKIDGIYDRFAICDIDQDGEKELLVNISSGSMSAAGLYIYGVNAARTGLEYIWSFNTDVTFYDTGFVKEDWSHNQGLASNFWPYSIYQRTSQGYSAVGGADAWEKAYMKFDFDGNPFPDEVDLNGNGIIYFIFGENGIDYDNLVDDAEYKEFEKRFFGSADDLYVPWQSLELDNVKEATGI